MRKFLVAVLFLFLTLPATAFGQEESTPTRQSFGFLDFQDVVPTEIVRVDPVEGRMVQALVAVDTFFIGNFTPGDSDNLSPEMCASFDSIISNVAPDQYIFLRGTADPMRWSGRYSEIEFARLNRSLAEARAMWAQNRAGMGKLLHPVINYPGRGVLIYVATYEDVATQLERYARVDTVKIITEIHYRPDTVVIETVKHAGVGIGLGLGLQGVYTHEFEFNIPTAQFVIDFEDRLYLAITGGYRPKAASDDPDDVPGDRSESLVAVNLEWYLLFDDYVALSFGYLSAYENIRAADEFDERVYGLTGGARLRLFDYKLVLGVDLGYFDTSKTGVTSTDRQFGISPFVRFNYIF